MAKEPEDRDEKLKRAGELVKKAVPEDFHGSIKFNLQPGRKKVKVNLDQTIVLEER